ncbi:unnamed protein product [Diatraea saccharalis]|uniref:Uncharacterized protein n=1 Tax=Diatraea saccharalis TaxID=40085 RepID=A0A9N9WAB4_9NEOP|nr:unnamed protein product [Diatraea saccharalis]
MERFIFLILSACVAIFHFETIEADTVLSAVLTPADDIKLIRQSRSYYDTRYGTGRPYERLEYDRPSRCGRCQDDRDDDDYDRRRDRFDDDRRGNHKPTYGNRYDRNKGDQDDDDRRYSTDRTNTKNGTEDEASKDKNQYDDKDRRPSSGGRRDRDRDRDRNRYDDRDRYRPDYYDRFLGDRYNRYDRDRYDRPAYDDSYRERRPLYDRYDDGYGDRNTGVGGRFDGYGYGTYRRPAYADRYDRVGAYDDSFGGYGPGVGRGPHDSFRPWDETYRGQAGWDAGGRGYYFASGRPDAAPAPSTAWGRPEYARPQYSESGWQNVGYTTGYRDPLDYRGTGYDNTGYRSDLSSGYGQNTGWRNVGRPYRDESGIPKGDDRDTRQPSAYGQYNQQVNRQPSYDQQVNRQPSYEQQANRQPSFDQQANRQPNYGQQSNRQPSYGQAYGQPASVAYSSSTTQNTNYLFEREDDRVTTKVTDNSTKATSS